MSTLTLKDLAKLAGVSYSTVSKALNDSHEISAETKRHIQALAKQYHYIQNARVRSIKLQKTYSLALIFSRKLMFDGDAMLLGSVLQQLLMREIERFGYMFTINASKNMRGESMVQRVCNQGIVDGFIFISDDIEPEDMHYLKASNIPFVFCMLAPEKLPKDISYFLPDDKTDGYNCTEFLIGRGHSRIVNIANAEKHNDYRLRKEGYEEAMARHDLPACFLQFSMDANEVEYLLQDRRAEIRQADALFIPWDGIAGAIMQHLAAENIAIPQNLSILGYNDYPITTFFRPMLTTMRDAREELCSAAIRHIIALINNPEAPVLRQKIPGQIVLRESVR